MAQQVFVGNPAPMWKPKKQEKKTPKYIKTKIDTKWIATRKAYLRGKANHAGYFRCEKCGKYTESVDVHHLQTRGSRADLKYDPANLVALCHPCHARIHGQVF